MRLGQVGRFVALWLLPAVLLSTVLFGVFGGHQLYEQCSPYGPRDYVDLQLLPPAVVCHYPPSTEVTVIPFGATLLLFTLVVVVVTTLVHLGWRNWRAAR